MAGTEETGTQRSQKMGKGAMGIRILGQIKLTPRWEMILCGCTAEVDGIVSRGRCGHPPDGNQAEGREGRNGLRRVEYLT